MKDINFPSCGALPLGTYNKLAKFIKFVKLILLITQVETKMQNESGKIKKKL